MPVTHTHKQLYCSLRLFIIQKHIIEFTFVAESLNYLIEKDLFRIIALFSDHTFNTAKMRLKVIVNLSKHRIFIILTGLGQLLAIEDIGIGF